MTITSHVTIECPECDGKGGFVCVDPYSVGCDETEETEPCRDCHGEGVRICENCDEPATVETREVVSVPPTSGYAGEASRRVYKSFFCEKCAKEVVQNGVV